MYLRRELGMRRFVVVGHRAITSAQFNLNDLCGSTGRLDVLLRCINSAFFLSHDFRRDVELYLVLQGEPNPPKTIRLKGDELKYLNPDERSTGALIRNALLKKIENQEGQEIMSTPGIYISKTGLKETLEKLSGISKLIYLREDGEYFDPKDSHEDLTFILSDDRNMTEDEEKEIQNFTSRICTLGSTSYHSDHCICIISWLMDDSD
jgi:tRNA (pseudouridine54-N1)-methyltransferase